ncbi:hypothetical protein, partial [Schaalia odontolytica]|uniref:hypothetical protein n=1 Tax=Schaalia odontolytica TaxID=1660 RepID=UPI001A93FFAE
NYYRTKTKTLKPGKNQPTKQSQPAIPTKNTQKQKTGIKNKQTHYRVHKQHPHTPENQAKNPATRAVNHHHKPTNKLAATGE